MISNYYLLPEFTPARPQDLVLWLEPASFRGNTWYNLAPNYSDRNHGTAHGGVGLSTWHPQFPPAPTFYGIDEYIDCGNNDSLDITDAGTLMCWFKTTRNNAIQGLISKQESGLGYETPYALRLLDDQFMVRLGDGSDLQNVEYTGVEINKWYFFVGAWDGDKVKLYVNGELKTEASQFITPYINDVSLLLSAEGPGHLLRFKGIIPLVCIYKAALTPAEIMYNYVHHPLYYIGRGIDPYFIKRKKFYFL